MGWWDVVTFSVDTVEEKSVVAIRPKPAIRQILEVATTRGGSGIILIKTKRLRNAKARRRFLPVLGGESNSS